MRVSAAISQKFCADFNLHTATIENIEEKAALLQANEGPGPMVKKAFLLNRP